MLFDKNYLTRGLVTYHSLRKHSPHMVLWILCMDDETYRILEIMHLPGVNILKLKDVEDEKLLTAKQNRTMTEYCWTLSSSLPLYVLTHNPHIESIGYLDSDLYFFSDIEPIYEEMGKDSILIIRHNYSERLKYLEKRSGIYNVSLVIFKNDTEGKKALEWWRERCIEWCYAYFEDGKLGDQMYLDDWVDRFKGVRVLKHKGANVAPWNINRYTILLKEGGIFVDEDPLIFYHYHSFKVYEDGTTQFYYSSYTISVEHERLLYAPYLSALEEAKKDIERVFPEFSPSYPSKPGFLVRFKFFLKKVATRYLVIH